MKSKIEAYEIKLKQEIQIEKISIDQVIIQQIIKELPNGKSIGFTEISNEMIKNASQPEIVSIITTLLKEIVKSGEIPYFFNVGKILPLVKNDKENCQDMNNIRPITVSDVLANIFEKYVDDHIG
jgi:hypothetical protein